MTLVHQGVVPATLDTPPPDLSVVIVTYRSAAHIGACLAALDDALAGMAGEVVVVDNASSDGTPALVRRLRPDATVLELTANVGFAPGVNHGLAVARGRHVLLLNPDTAAAPGSLAALVRFADAHPGAGVVAPRLVNPDGSDQRTARSFPTPAAAVLGRRSPLARLAPRNRWTSRYLSGQHHTGDAAFEIDWVSGACLLVPRAVLDEVGPLDPGFFMYWEDADWCRRIKAAGRSVHCVPTAVVAHDEGATRRRVPPRQVVHFHRSAYRYYAKHHLAARRRPLRPVAAVALAARAAGVIGAGTLRRA